MLATLAFAHAHAADDPFASWMGRWSIEMEETTPAPVELSAEANRSFFTRAVQIRAVLGCGEVRPYGKNMADVTCAIEQISVHATPRTTEVAPAVLEASRAVLDDLVARLAGSHVVLTVSADGRVATVDLPDIRVDNQRESESREVLRRLMFDVVAGLHLKRPEAWSAGWVEKNSLLVRAPTQPASSGMSKVTHTVATIEGATVAQSSGKGTFTAPYEPWEFAYDGKTPVQRGSQGTKTGGSPGSGGIGAGSTMSVTATGEGDRSSGPGTGSAVPADQIFEGSLTSVAVLDPTGHPVERVWALVGHPTASSLGNMQGWSIWYAGRARKLAPDEAVDVGATRVVAPPGARITGIDPWTPLETF